MTQSLKGGEIHSTHAKTGRTRKSKNFGIGQGKNYPVMRALQRVDLSEHHEVPAEIRRSDPVEGLHRCCPICNTDNGGRPPSSYSRAGWMIKRCTGCGFVYLENPPAYDGLKGKYAWEKTSCCVSDFKRRENPLLYRYGSVIKHIRKKVFKRDKLLALVSLYFRPGPVLDIGCGDGGVLMRLGKAFVPYGIEISDQLAAKAHRYASIRGGGVLNDNALSGLSSFQEKFFEGAIMSAYLEHEVNPFEVLKKALRVLTVGGRLIVKVPNFGSYNRLVMGKKWCGFRFPDHVNYWSPPYLTHTLERAGFQVVRFNLLDRFPTSDNMWIVSRRP